MLVELVVQCALRVVDEVELVHEGALEALLPHLLDCLAQEAAVVRGNTLELLRQMCALGWLPDSTWLVTPASSSDLDKLEARLGSEARSSFSASSKSIFVGVAISAGSTSPAPYTVHSRQ